MSVLPSLAQIESFDPALAQDKNPARRLAFHKQHRSLGIRGRVGDSIKGLQRGGGQVAEEAVGAHLAHPERP